MVFALAQFSVQKIGSDFGDYFPMGLMTGIQVGYSTGTSTDSERVD